MLSSQETVDLAIRAKEDIHAIGRVLFWSVIPLALLPPVSLKWKWIFIRCLIITLVVWQAYLHYHTEFEVPWNTIVFDLQDEQSSYDGVGGNAALLFLGWIPPPFMSLGSLSFLKLITSLAIRRRHATKDVTNEAPSTPD